MRTTDLMNIFSILYAVNKVTVSVVIMLYMFYISNHNHSVIAPGCLAHPDDSTATALLNTLALLKNKVRICDMC